MGFYDDIAHAALNPTDWLGRKAPNLLENTLGAGDAALENMSPLYGLGKAFYGELSGDTANTIQKAKADANTIQRPPTEKEAESFFGTNQEAKTPVEDSDLNFERGLQSHVALGLGGKTYEYGPNAAPGEGPLPAALHGTFGKGYGGGTSDARPIGIAPKVNPGAGASRSNPNAAFGKSFGGPSSNVSMMLGNDDFNRAEQAKDLPTDVSNASLGNQLAFQKNVPLRDQMLLSAQIKQMESPAGSALTANQEVVGSRDDYIMKHIQRQNDMADLVKKPHLPTSIAQGIAEKAYNEEIRKLLEANKGRSPEGGILGGGQ